MNKKIAAAIITLADDLDCTDREIIEALKGSLISEEEAGEIFNAINETING